jgi:hypothetical protein
VHQFLHCNGPNLHFTVQQLVATYRYTLPYQGESDLAGAGNGPAPWAGLVFGLAPLTPERCGGQLLGVYSPKK